AFGFGGSGEEHHRGDVAAGNAGVAAIADDPFGRRPFAAGCCDVAMLHVPGMAEQVIERPGQITGEAP
ncbi:MAG: hypothetical protein WBF34_37015, partial [Streptosporangiaceae bacterium]